MPAPSPNWVVDEIIDHLRALGSDENRAGMARFGIVTDRSLGVRNTALRSLARALKRDHERALALWETGWREARLLAVFTDDPKQVTAEQVRRWADGFDSWEIVDSASTLFVEAGHFDLVPAFAADEREFVLRAAFAMMAGAAVHRKNEPDATFIEWLVLIERHANDPRNFVRKAVNWALRQIGKRSTSLHAAALASSRRLAESSDRTARWIGNDAIRELTAARTLARIEVRQAEKGSRKIRR
ncbi:DNA alkylation repair protein [Aquibium carbonis]|uniref:DNA alkylation repair protein n=1 Tax=Aquibium carbonis TaxID=2495581 RepID=A0A429YZD5_9HYPH|nr:DNA alkylation repair protein [Aquibium carbonis]RST86688.1 DNA alkylation repair protein [Aquibium carbonis]